MAHKAQITIETVSPDDSNQKTVLTFAAVSKRFGKVIANDQLSFSIKSGSIHAIVGENGAGKSTLSKILSGYYRPDSGGIFINDQEILLNSPSQARTLGIGMVHQQLALVPSLTGFENVLLGEPSLSFAYRKREIETKILLRARELGFHFNLSCPVSELGIAERQKLEIFKLLWRDMKILILDEPTSQLTPFESQEILSIADDLAKDGRIVILITHHIAEVMQFAKYVTILRKGRHVDTVHSESLRDDDLAKLMIDADLSITKASPKTVSGSPIVSLQNISTTSDHKHKALQNIDLEICKGEVVGVAGISGSGQNELGMLLTGLIDSTSGAITGEAENSSGLANISCYIPGDQKIAFAANLSVAVNCFIKSVNVPNKQKFGFVSTALIRKDAQQIIDSFQISPRSCNVLAGALSGGNMQRLIIGRELATGKNLIIADNPCAGLDASMSLRIRQQLRDAASNGKAVVLISPDLEELISTCDRIVVMFNGRINGVLNAEQFCYQSLAVAMGGKTEPANLVGNSL